MPVNTIHNSYAAQRNDWQKCRDTVEGERIVKARRDDYLPVPPGMTTSSNQVLENGKRHSPHDRYSFYLSFAEFPEVVAPAVDGFQGIIHTNPPRVELPPGLEYLLEEATPEGEPLDVLWERITREILTVGRVALLCDVNGGDQIKLATYSAENLINWRLGPRSQGAQPEFIVVREFREVPDADDEFKTEGRVVYRELRIRDGVYQRRVWEAKTQQAPLLSLLGGTNLTSVTDNASEEPEITEDWETPMLFGRPFTQIPILILNVEDVGFEYGPIPILPMVRRSLSIYRKTADYNRSLYIKSDPQPVISGITRDQAPDKIGGEAIWCLPNPQARAEYLDIDGNGIPLQRQAINDEFERFSQEGGKLLDTSDRPAESGEAIRRRQASNQVSLRSIAKNGGENTQFALRKIAVLSGEDPQAVKFEADLDFAEPLREAREALDLTVAKAQGLRLSDESIHEWMRKGGLTRLSFEEEQARLEKEPRGVDGLTITPETVVETG